MIVLGESEFKRYVYASEHYEQLKLKQKQTLDEAYLDSPYCTTCFDSQLGRVFIRSCNVEDYVMDLIEMQEAMENQRERILERIKLFKLALTYLEPHERTVIEEFRTNQLNDYSRPTRAIIQRFKEYLESVIAVHKNQKLFKNDYPDISLIEEIEHNLEAGKKQYLINGRFQYLTEVEYAACKDIEPTHFIGNIPIYSS